MPDTARASSRDRSKASERIAEYTTSRTRAGRPFVATVERALDPALRSLAARLPRAAGGVVVVPEMPGPYGVPDLVAIPNPRGLTARLESPVQALLAWGDALVVASASAVRPLSPQSIASRAGLGEAITRKRLRRLALAGAVVDMGDGRYTRVPALAPVGRVYTLEAKIDNWSAGFSQALRYGSWADASAVVLAQPPADRSTAIEQARNLGIGLAAGTRWLVRPRIHQHPPGRRLWASEHVVAALRASEYTDAARAWTAEAENSPEAF